MIDKYSEIFTYVSQEIKKEYPNILVTGEYSNAETQFPCITLEEISNLPSYIDSASVNRFASIRYRVQVFSNSTNGKKAEARKIYSSVDKILQKLGMIPNSFVTTPNLYNSTVFQITAIYNCVIDEDGMIYRR